MTRHFSEKHATGKTRSLKQGNPREEWTLLQGQGGIDTLGFNKGLLTSYWEFNSHPIANYRENKSGTVLAITQE